MTNLGDEHFKDVDDIIEKYSAGIPGSTALAKKEIELQLAQFLAKKIRKVTLTLSDLTSDLGMRVLTNPDGFKDVKDDISMRMLK